MSEPMIYDRFSCEICVDKGNISFDFTMAFQPIIDCRTKSIFGYEALVRGLKNESTFSFISQVDEENVIYLTNVVESRRSR